MIGIGSIVMLNPNEQYCAGVAGTYECGYGPFRVARAHGPFFRLENLLDPVDAHILRGFLFRRGELIEQPFLEAVDVEA